MFKILKKQENILLMRLKKKDSALISKKQFEVLSYFSGLFKNTERQSLIITNRLLGNITNYYTLRITPVSIALNQHYNGAKIRVRFNMKTNSIERNREHMAPEYLKDLCDFLAEVTKDIEKEKVEVFEEVNK